MRSCWRILSKVVTFPVDVNTIRLSEGDRPAWSKRRDPSTSSLIKISGSRLETSFHQRFHREMYETIDSPCCRHSGPYGLCPTWNRIFASCASMGKNEVRIASAN
eukprot:5324315-Pyramimonas_sp.AAC.1